MFEIPIQMLISQSGAASVEGAVDEWVDCETLDKAFAKLTETPGTRTEEEKTICLFVGILLILVVKQIRKELRELNGVIDSIEKPEDRIATLAKRHILLVHPLF